MSESFKINFQCVTVAIVELIPLPLRDILARHINPANLYNKIESNSSLKNQLQHQLKICYLQPPDMPDYNKFDVSLLYKLIRNLCDLPSPSQGWGNEPKSSDTQLSDDIERLRLFRNNYYGHVDSAEISDVLFNEIWMNLKCVLKRIRFQLNCKVDYEQKLSNIEQFKITQYQFDTCRLLLDAHISLQTQKHGRDEPIVLVKGLDEVICGETARFEADVETAELSHWSIIWQRRKGDTIACIDTNKKEYRGSTNRILVIQSVCKDDEGEYQVVLSRESNGPIYKSKNSIRLHVLGELPILNDLKVTTVYDGVIIQCNYELSRQSPEVHCIQWKKNGQPLDTKTTRYIEGNVDDKYLKIASTTYEDRGEYSCTVTNAVGSVSKNIMLGVPTVKLSIDSTFLFGSRAILNAEVSATPFPENAKWQKSKDGNNFHRINITNLKYYGSKDIPESPVLVVSNISFEDKLHYRLLVTNKIGDGISDTVYFNVTGSRPNITTSEHTNIKERSIKLVGKVFVYDDSPDIIEVFWTKNEKKIERVYNPTLTIRDVSDKDAGWYQLTAINAVGSTTSDAIVLGKPNVFFERPMTKTDGSHWFFVTIQAIPAPCSVMWSSKSSDDDSFIPVDINACDYKGTTLSFPHPVLVVNKIEKLEKRTYQIEVANFIGKTVKQIPERTIYKKRNAGIRFVKFSNYLANNFPAEKLLDLKYILRASGKVTDVNSLKAADTVLKCFIVLQDENLFTQNNVIFMQFLFKEMHCEELYEKCIQFAQEQEALCFFFKPPDNGYKNVKFHIQGDFNNYSKEQIEFIREEVAAMLECEDKDILENGAMEASSFMLVLSIKETYTHKLYTLGKQDRLKLRKLNIDFFIVDKETILLESENGNVGEKLYKEKDAGFEFAKLSYILANQFPKEKLQNLKDIIIVAASGRDDAMDSIKTAESVLKCFSILQDEHLFTENIFSYIQFLCKETSCDKLCTICKQLALATAQEESKVLKHDLEEHSISEETAPLLQRRKVKTYDKLFRGGFDNAWRYENPIISGKASTRPIMNQSAAGRHNNEGEQQLIYQRKVPIEPSGSSLIYPKCLKHSTKYCELHCEQCDTHICSECCTSAEHDTHKRVNILDWLQNKKEIIENDLQELEDTIILKHQTIIAKIPCQRDGILQNAVQIATALHTQEEHLHREIVNVNMKLKAVLYEMDSKYLAFLQKQEEKHRQSISEILQLISDLNSLLLSDDSCFTKYESKNADFRNPIQPTVSFPNFLPTQFKRKHIYQLLGCLSKLSIKKEEDYVLNFPDPESSFDGISISEEPKVVTNIHTNYGIANKLRSVTAATDTEIWTCGEDKTMKLYTLQGEVIQSIQTKSKNTPSDIEVTRSGDLVYADYNDLSINIVRNAQISDVIKLQGWRPRNVCSTLYDDFLVFMDSETERQSKIVRYCGTIQKQSISLNDKGQPLYSYGPSFKYMSENKNLDICVADWGASAVVVVNYAGKHRFTYMGPPSSSSAIKDFDPYGITTDSQSRILIADCFNHRIHILHQDGQFLCFIGNCGLDRPVDLCVDSKDNLFVAERFTGNVKKIRYKK